MQKIKIFKITKEELEQLKEEIYNELEGEIEYDDFVINFSNSKNIPERIVRYLISELEREGKIISLFEEKKE